jgi:hypothetical protein
LARAQDVLDGKVRGRLVVDVNRTERDVDKAKAAKPAPRPQEDDGEDRTQPLRDRQKAAQGAAPRRAGAGERRRGRTRSCEPDESGSTAEAGAARAMTTTRTPEARPMRGDLDHDDATGLLRHSVANPSASGAAGEADRVGAPYAKVLDYSNPPFRSWFVGGETNLCFNAVGPPPHRPRQAGALVWISTEVDQTRSSPTAARTTR